MDKIVTKLTAEFLRSMAHPVRIQVIKLLSEEEKCVRDILDIVGIEQSNLSQHLSVLKKQGIIDSRQNGTKVIYNLVYYPAVEIVDTVGQVLRTRVFQSQMLLEHL